MIVVKLQRKSKTVIRQSLHKLIDRWRLIYISVVVGDLRYVHAAATTHLALLFATTGSPLLSLFLLTDCLFFFIFKKHLLKNTSIYLLFTELCSEVAGLLREVADGYEIPILICFSGLKIMGFFLG